MKSRFTVGWLGITMCVCVLLSGCQAAPVGSSVDRRLDDAGGNRAVPQLPGSGSYLPEEYIGMKIQENYLEFDRAYTPTLDNLRSLSEYVVQGTVAGYTNTIVGRSDGVQSPWTVIHLKDVRTLKGQAKPAADGGMDIYTYGGYIPLRTQLGNSLEAHGQSISDEEMDKIVIHECYDGSDLPAEGEAYVFYLVWRDKGEPVSCYELMMGSYGQMYTQGEQYIRCGYENEGIQVLTLAEVLG